MIKMKIPFNKCFLLFLDAFSSSPSRRFRKGKDLFKHSSSHHNEKKTVGYYFILTN